VLYRLLQDFDPDRYCLISRNNYDRRRSDHIESATGWLPAKYYHLRDSAAGLPRWPGLRRVAHVVNTLSRTVSRARQLARIIARERCRAVLATTGDTCDMNASYLAARWTRSAFYAYIFDDFRHQNLESRLLRFIARLQPIMLKKATAVIVPNEFLRDAYREQYGIAPVVIHNPVETSSPVQSNHLPSARPELSIVYTGDIYAAHYDAFRNLIQAINESGHDTWKLHVYTARPRDLLEREGIGGPVIWHDYVSLDVAKARQHEADVLFLPLAFDSPYPEVIRTSAPGKIGDYLVSGRPILVHSPKDSFISDYFTKHDCGAVVDTAEPHRIVEAIERLILDADYRSRLVSNALHRAKADFDVSEARRVFEECLTRG